MTEVELGVLVGSLLAATAGFLYVATKLSAIETSKGPETDLVDGVSPEVDHIFNDEFREELKNRGRLHFEKLISENAMFLQQDLRLTAAQINEFMKGEITKKLQAEFTGYQQSIDDAKKLAVDSISKTQDAIEQQRKEMTEQIAKELEEEKLRAIKRFNENMGEIVNHYVVGAIGSQIQLDDQMEFILNELNSNKEDIIKDIQNGA